MLALERRPVEPRARTDVHPGPRPGVPTTGRQTSATSCPGSTDAEVHQLATYAMAGADGLFIAKEIGGDAVDLVALFELHGRAIYDVAIRLARQNTQ